MFFFNSDDMSSPEYRSFESSSFTDFDHMIVSSGKTYLKWGDDYLEFSDNDGPLTYSIKVDLSPLSSSVEYSRTSEMEGENIFDTEEVDMENLEKYFWIVNELDQIIESYELDELSKNPPELNRCLKEFNQIRDRNL